MKEIYNQNLVDKGRILNKKKSWRWQKMLSLFLMFLMCTLGFAQTGTIQIGSGSGTTSGASTTIPITNYNFSYTQHLITAAEYSNGGGISGNITKVRFKATTLGTLTVWNNWTVYIGNTSKTSFSSTTDWVSTANMTQVFSGVLTPSPTAGNWFEITFSTPFNYTGGNIVLAIDENTSGYLSTPAFSTYTSAANTGIVVRSDTVNPDPASPGTANSRTATLPQIQFEGTKPSCSGVPTGGTASLSVTTGNSGSTFTASVTGANIDAGIAYQWQKFISGAWQDIAGATTASAVITAETGSVGTATNYRLKVTCTNSSEIAYSSEVTHTLALVYCASTYSSGPGTSDGITNVTLGTLNNASTQNAVSPFYTFFNSATIPDVAQSTNASISITFGSDGSQFAGVWIDFNQNGTFEASEGVVSTVNAGVSGTSTLSILVPADAVLGNTRMRVRGGNDTALTTAQACGASSSGYGETEEYIVNITAAPSCLAPTALASSAVTANTATLSWTASTSSPSNGYDVYYSTTNTAPLVGTAPTVNNHTASPLNVTSLTSASTYYWWVRSDCGADVSAWNYGGSFTTLCEALIAPTAVENFETFNGTAPSPICWSEATGTLALNTTLSGTTSGWLLKGSGFANASAANKGFSINLYSTANEWMISPAIDLGSTAGLYRLKYRYAVTSYNGTATVPTLGTHKVDVVISTDGGATWSNANSIKTYTGAATYSNSGAFETINLTAYSGVVKIAFVTSTTSTSPDIDFHVDDFSVESIPNCLEPTALTVSNVGFNVADLSWISAGTSFDLEWGTQGFTQGAGTTVNLASNSYTLSGLSAGTNYNFYVRNLCGGSNSTWVGPFSFTTLTKASVTWTEGFATTTLPSGFVNSGFTIGTTTALSTGATTSYMYKNLWSSGISANFETIYVGNLGSNDRLKFNYRLADYASPYTAPAAESGNFKVEIKQFPSTDWIVLATVSNNAVEGWQEVSYNLAAYAGEIVKIRITGTWISGDYFLGVDNLVIEPTPCPEWTGAVSTAWNVAGNWCDNTVPSALTNVIVNSANPAIISTDVTIASITLGASANVTVNGTLNVGNISVATGGMMTVANNAVVLQTALATNSGMVTVKRNSSDLFRQDYTLWSSPVAGQNLRAFSTQTLFNRFSSYDNTIGANGDYVQEIITTADVTNKTFTNAKGYLIRMPNNWVEVASSNPAMPYLGSFTGALNNGAVSIALSGANNKLNLVGNPYASPISIAAFFAANTNLDQTLYFWRKKASATPGNTASGYATYNTMGFVSADTDINGVVPTNIQTGQGFFVVANSAAPGNLVFNNTMRNNGAATFYKGAAETNELHRLWLNLSSANDVVGQTLIGYKTNATQGVDAGVDALYFNDSPTALTSLINNTEYIIQGRSVPFVNTDVVPLGFKSNVAGSYTIALANFDGLFAENQDIFLKDNVTGTLNNLKLASYTFMTQEGIFNERFEVLYANTTLGTNNPIAATNTILVGVKDQKITINAGTVTMDKVELIDVAGRVIYMLDGVNATTATLQNVVSANQMLIVRISTKENGIVTQKIIF